MASTEHDLVWREIVRIGTCMMVTRDGVEVRARPMVGTADREGNRVWFIAHRGDGRDAEIGADPRVCLAYVDIASNTFVALTGHAEVVDDRQRMRDLWSSPLDAEFDNGVEDDAAVLIGVTPEIAEVWDEPNADIVTALEMLTASPSDGRPTIGGNRTVRMTNRRR